MSTRSKVNPEVGQWWALDKCFGVITKVLPGGAGNAGIAVFDGDVPPAHVSTMLSFSSWRYLGTDPPTTGLEAPCTCIDVGGVILSTDCQRHNAARATSAHDARALTR